MKQVERRIKELEARIVCVERGYQAELTDTEILELRALRTLRNAVNSRNGIGVIDKEVAQYLTERMVA